MGRMAEFCLRSFIIARENPNDIVWFPPGEKHWHGAAPTTALTHIAIQEARDGKAGFLFLAKASPLFVTLFS